MLLEGVSRAASATANEERRGAIIDRRTKSLFAAKMKRVMEIERGLR